MSAPDPELMLKLGLIPARPSAEDAELVMRWRNDPATLAMSYHSDPKTWDQFWPEYQRDYFPGGALNPVFLSDGSEKLGFIRFRKYEPLRSWRTVAQIDINIRPDKRGQRLGAQGVRLACRRLFAERVDAVVAEIKYQNAASASAFEAAGFEFYDDADKEVPDISQTFRIKRYICHE